MKTKNKFLTSEITIDRSYQMRILSVIAIAFVVFGHIRFGQFRNDMTALGTFHGWFPYYSFHLPLFLFISGYFYKDISEGNPDAGGSFGRAFLRFLWKKVRTLLFPYFIINGLFLLLGSWLLPQGITFLTPFSFTEWLIHPWTRLYSITFSVPTWYLVSLFIAEMIFVFFRKLMQLCIHKPLPREIAILILTLISGVVSVFFCNTYKVPQAAQVYLRSVVMLFFIEVGIIYRKYLEPHDRLNSGWYFLIVFALQFVLIVLSGNNPLSPGLYGMVYFEQFGYDYFLAGLTGVALWLRITRLLASIPHQSRVIKFIGANTKYIMSFHVFGFFLLNSIFAFLYTHHAGGVLLKDFSVRTWKSYLYYADIDNTRMILLYFFAGMGFSLLVAWIIRLVKRLLWRS